MRSSTPIGVTEKFLTRHVDAAHAKAAQQAVEAVGRASGLASASCLSPVVKYHGLGHRFLYARGFLVRPQLNSGTLDRRGRNLDVA
jgi:hypothetical protein